MRGSLSKDKHFVAKELIKLNNTTNICLTRLNIILNNPYSLDTGEYLICQIYQQNCNRLKNHTHFQLNIL